MKTKSVRVVVPNTVYLTNLPSSLTEAVLSQPEFLAQYGKLEKVVVHKNKSAHINFFSPHSATICMKHVDGFYYDGARITAQEGTTKYAEDINHKALRLADLNEPIRPAPKYPVFPPPRSYKVGRPAALGDFYVGTGTLVDKTWAGTGDRLSPGSIHNFKNGFIPRLPIGAALGASGSSGLMGSLSASAPAYAAQYDTFGKPSVAKDDEEDDDHTPRGVADLDDDTIISVGSTATFGSSCGSTFGANTVPPPGLAVSTKRSSSHDYVSGGGDGHHVWRRNTAPARLIETAAKEVHDLCPKNDVFNLPAFSVQGSIAKENKATQHKGQQTGHSNGAVFGRTYSAAAWARQGQHGFDGHDVQW